MTTASSSTSKSSSGITVTSTGTSGIQPTCTPPTTAWSCDHPTDPLQQHYCTETYDSDPTVISDIQTNCTSDSGTFATMGCSHTSTIGFCSAVSNGELGSIYFYDASQSAQDQAQCAQLNGLWCPI